MYNENIYKLIMLPTIILIILYIGLIYFGYIQTKKLRDFLLQQNATAPQAAIPIDRDKYFVLTTKFNFSAIHETEQGLVWIDIAKWQRMIYTFGFFIVISIITLIFILLSYL